jgi:cytochrome P450
VTTIESQNEITRPIPVLRTERSDRTPLYGEEFARDPERVYARLRRRGPLAPVELSEGVPATLVTDYATALRVLRAAHVFVKDSRPWQETVPADCPVLPMMSWRPNTLFADGPAHARLRPPVTDSLAGLDPADLRDYVRRSATTLISGFGPAGAVDLLSQYATPLPLLVLHQMFGCSPELSGRIVAAIAAMWDGSDAQAANEELEAAMRELVAQKRRQRGNDITSRLVDHSHQLSDDELLHQLIVMMGAGVEPVGNWIANALLLLLTEDRFADNLAGGSVTIDEALDEVLWRSPPLANYSITYPVRPVRVAGTLLPAGQPVVISIAAANTEVAARSGRATTGNRAHLSFSAGPHSCPAREPARLIATVALETVLDSLPGLRLAPETELAWRPGPFHRALTALPAVFPPPVSVEESEGSPSCPHMSSTATPMPTTEPDEAPRWP